MTPYVASMAAKKSTMDAADEHRASQGAPLRGGDAGHRLQHLVETGFAGQRPGGPVTRNAAVDELRLPLPQVVIADLQALCGARTEILDNDVCLAHQAIHDLCGPRAV